MKTIRIRRGFDLPLAGLPAQSIDTVSSPVRRVAVLGPDYPGLRPSLAVAPGDRVRAGDLLFADKRHPEIRFTAPGTGRVTEVHRGEKRALLGVEIALETESDPELFDPVAEGRLGALDSGTVRDRLLSSGLWTALRRRPFGTVPPPEEVPAALFVTAIDTEPLAADPAVVLASRHEEFSRGLAVLGRLSPGPLYLCLREEGNLPASDGVTVAGFSGPHPAGLPGTHIHFLHPASAERPVWYIEAQDVAAVGHLFTRGRLLTERIVSLGGPSLARPRLVRTRLGAHIGDLLRDELPGGDHRVISGSVLSGRTAAGALNFLGRYHRQVTVLPEGGGERPFAGVRPGSAFLPRRPRPFTTARRGEHRAIFPVDSYQRVMPLDLPAVYLLRALAVGDVEEAVAFGCLELEEDDLALCSVVCPGKNDFGPMLRAVLTSIEKEG